MVRCTAVLFLREADGHDLLAEGEGAGQPQHHNVVAEGAQVLQGGGGGGPQCPKQSCGSGSRTSPRIRKKFVSNLDPARMKVQIN